MTGRIPNRVTLWCCPVCGRQGSSALDYGKGGAHFSRGARCEGKPKAVMYVRERRAEPKL